MNIPLFAVSLGQEEYAGVRRVLQSGQLSRGSEVATFERVFASFVKKKHAIAVANGTCGLHLAIKAQGWTDGDEVLVSPLTYIATGNALIYEKVRPVFVDIDPQTLNINPEKCFSAVTSRTRGLLGVHILGLPLIPDAFKPLIQEANLSVVEDACQAIGRVSSSFPVGHLGKISVYSFFENKPMTTGGEGGMIVTDDDYVAEQCRSWRDQGRSSAKNWIDNVVLGYNYRMTDMQAAVGLAQLSKLPSILAYRERVAAWYAEELTEVQGIYIADPTVLRRSWFAYFIHVDSLLLRQRIVNALRSHGVESREGYFPPLYRFPQFRHLGKKEDFPVCEWAYQSLLMLPIHNGLSRESVRHIAGIIRNVSEEL